MVDTIDLSTSPSETAASHRPATSPVMPDAFLARRASPGDLPTLYALTKVSVPSLYS